MDPGVKKKLIEVALPLDAINAASVREKSIRHGHPSTLHLWWARRPLAACRAVLFAQLVDDPSSHPEKFPTPEAVESERKRLFGIIEDLVKWENSTNEEVLARARAEISRSCNGELPPIYDPFSGGGAIPLEAQRLGLPAYGSDLNPVAVVIGKAMIEIPPRFKGYEPAHPDPKERNHYRNAEGLAEDVKYYGSWMRERAFKHIGHLYPEVDLPKEHGGGKATVIAWIWARTVPSPDPAFSDVQVPIASSFLLSSKAGKEAWIEPIVDKAAKTIHYHMRKGGTKDEIATAKGGTKAGRGAHFQCLLSGSAIPPNYVKACGKTGKMSQTLIAIAAEGKGRRIYIEPIKKHAATAYEARPSFRPEMKISGSTQYLGVKPYGMDRFDQLFTDRQLVALSTFNELVHEARSAIERDALVAGFSDDPTPLCDSGTGAKAYAEAVSVYLYFCIGKLADLANSLCRWEPIAQCPRNLFGRQAIPMIWDFAEGNIFSKSSGSFEVVLKGISGALQKNTFNYPDVPSSIVQSNATTFRFSSQRTVVSSDPPYYDNVPYADISDFFFCWMKCALRPVYPDLFEMLATPKQEELIAAPYRHGSKEAAENFFLDGMTKAIANMAQQTGNAYPATIYYAFKQGEVSQEGISSTGWATFLQAVITAGYAVVGTWPIRTENASRLRGQRSNALANSVVLVCRKRDDNAEILSRAEFIRALKRELPPAIETLQKAYIAPADMPQAAIGPGMAVFSRCKAVLEAADTPMPVKTALQLINRELDEYLGGIQGAFDDETRFALTWFEQHGIAAGDFGAANSIATARGISVESVRHAGIVEASGGKVRILGRDEIDPNWDPAQDKHLTVWECSQHLVLTLEHDGESGAAMLLRRIGPRHADATRDLAYCLYDIAANKRKDAAEATAWNGLIAVWPELTRQAAAIRETRDDLQGELDL
ncbi:MAG: DUF1156 domain-containing protein [Nitrospinae bacterium]|nr:DUF1156 domain-containing protein [Nitrospinota bacterium]